MGNHEPDWWQALPEDVLTVEHWEPDSIVYNCLSGETHQLNSVAVEVLKLLQAKPGCTETLSDQICAILDLENKAAMVAQIRRLITEFDNLGLISPVPK